MTLPIYHAHAKEGEEAEQSIVTQNPRRTVSAYQTASR